MKHRAAKKIRASLCIFLLFVAFLPTHAYADDNPCRIGGLYEDQGIGGTGSPINNSDQDPDGNNKGLGGTGHESNGGIGGTGNKHVYVTGTIYAFGSICVNGLRISYDPQIPVQDGTNVHTTEKLKIGHVVRVLAEGNPSSLHLQARHIEIEYPVKGIISHIDHRNGEIRVMSERVSVPQNEIKGLALGQRIQVSGLRTADNRILSSRIEPADTSKNSIEGPVTKTADGQLSIGLTRISGFEDRLTPKQGTKVHIDGLWSGEVLKIEDIQDPQKLMQQADYASIETYRDSDLPSRMEKAIVSGHIHNGQFKPEYTRQLELQPEDRSDHSGSGRKDDNEDQRGNSGRNEEDDRDGSGRDDTPESIEEPEDRESGREDRSGRRGGDDRAERADTPEDVEKPDRIERPDDSHEAIDRPEDVRPEIETPDHDDRPERPEDDDSGHGGNSGRH